MNSLITNYCKRNFMEKRCSWNLGHYTNTKLSHLSPATSRTLTWNNFSTFCFATFSSSSNLVKWLILQRDSKLIIKWAHNLTQPIDTFDPVHTTPEKFENTALFLRLGLPFTLIRHKKGTFRKRSSNRRNLKMPALCFLMDGKHCFENRALRKRWRREFCTPEVSTLRFSNFFGVVGTSPPLSIFSDLPAPR